MILNKCSIQRGIQELQQRYNDIISDREADQKKLPGLVESIKILRELERKMQHDCG